MRRSWVVLIGVLAAFVLAALPSVAQVTTGTILGTVRDPQSAAVPGATVTLTDQGKGTSHTATTDTQGSYIAPFLIPGTYEVTVELAGFKKHVRRGVVLQVNQRARVDVVLELGGLTETTEVVALAPLTRTDSAEVGEVIEERAIRELPLNGRNFATLVYLAPGITPGQSGENLSGASHLQPPRRVRTSTRSAPGQLERVADRRHRQQRVHLQHGHRHALGRVGPRVQGPDRHLLRGVRPRGGRRLASRPSRATTSSTGPSFEFLRNEKFDAKNFFAPARPRRRPPLDRHQYGAQLSRPDRQEQDLLHGRLRRPLREPGRDHASTPSPPRRPASATSATTAIATATSSRSTTRSPHGPTRTGPASCATPSRATSSPPTASTRSAATWPASIPLPNGTGNFDNYTSTTDRAIRDYSFTVRVDHRQGDRDSFFVRYTYDKYKLDAPQGQATCCLPTPPEAAAALRPRALRGRHPEHAPHRHGRRLQLDAHLRPLGRERAARRLREDEPRDPPVGLRHRTPPTSLGIQGINVSRVHDRPAQPQHPGPHRDLGRPRLPPREPQADPLPDRGHDLPGQGPPRAQGRLPFRPAAALPVHQHRHPQQHLGQPQPHQQPADQQPGIGHRHAPARIHDGRRPGLPARAVRHDELRARALHPGRLEGLRPHHREPRPALRRLRPGHREGQQAGQLRPRGSQARLRGRGRDRPPGQQADRLGQHRPPAGHRLGRHR